MKFIKFLFWLFFITGLIIIINGEIIVGLIEFGIAFCFLIYIAKAKASKNTTTKPESEPEAPIETINEKVDDQIHCPKCNSTQITANKKGYGAGKGLGGVLLTGGIGLLAGFIGSKKIKITCLKCGHTWKAGQL